MSYEQTELLLMYYPIIMFLLFPARSHPAIEMPFQNITHEHKTTKIHSFFPHFMLYT